MQKQNFSLSIQRYRTKAIVNFDPRIEKLNKKFIDLKVAFIFLVCNVDSILDHIPGVKNFSL